MIVGTFIILFIAFYCLTVTRFKLIFNKSQIFLKIDEIKKLYCIGVAEEKMFRTFLLFISNINNLIRYLISSIIILRK